MEESGGVEGRRRGRKKELGKVNEKLKLVSEFRCRSNRGYKEYHERGMRLKMVQCNIHSVRSK